MKKFKILGPIFLLLALSKLSAVPFEPKFSDYAFPGTQYTVDAAANAFFSTNYGITISNAYLYKDSRDTFDGIGVSTGTTSEFGTTQTARIDFLDTTNFLSIDYWTILATTYSILDGGGNVLDTFSFGSNVLGNHTFNSASSNIAAIVWTSQTGFGQISGLSYDYDGKTDGHNDDVGTSRVPDASDTGILLVTCLGAIATFCRRFRK